MLQINRSVIWQARFIFAPNADLILGQSNKKLYGRFLGRNITVHQYATVYSVNFNPEISTEFIWRGK